MRMWLGVDPAEMCRKHLLGEHNEMHKLLGCLRKGRSIRGYLEKRYLDPPGLFERHALLWHEMVLRGYRHNSPMYGEETSRLAWQVGSCFTPNNPLDYFAQAKINRLDLAARCPECAARIKKEASNETV